MPKRTPKVDPRVEGLAAAMTEEHDELLRLGEIQHHLEGDIAEVARSVLAKDGLGECGVASAWLRAIVGQATEADVNAIAELAASAKSHRVPLAKAVGLVAGRIDAARLATIVANLEQGVPFDTVVLGARQTIAPHADRGLLERLDARASFVERHAATLVHCVDSAKERDRDAASTALMRLTGDDRLLAALWVESEGQTSRTALKWAQEVLIVEPSADPLFGAHALAAELDEAILPSMLERAGEPRVAALVVLALQRDWSNAVANATEGLPTVFRRPEVFAAVEAALENPDVHLATALFASRTRHWTAPLEAAQAAAIAGHMVRLLGSDEEGVVKAVENACNYFEHPAGVPVFRAALEDPKSSFDLRDSLYDVLETIPGDASSQVLVDRLFVEQQNLRDLVFAYNKRVPAAWQRTILDRITAEKSLHAAWVYVACQVHWAHHPRHVVAMVEQVLTWPKQGDAKKRAMIMSHAVRAALELHRFDLARTCLTELGGAKKAIDATETKEVDTVLGDDGLKDTLAKLRSKALDATDAALVAKLEKARAAGKSVAVSDEELGTLAGSLFAFALHRDAQTNEVWFFDKESELFYFNGNALAPPPFTMKMFIPDHGWDIVLDGLADFCAGWVCEGRSLHRSDDDYRYVLRSGARVLMRFSGHVNGMWSWPFGFTFPDAAAAERAFAAIEQNPLTGYRVVDPFYVEGKRGNGWQYEYGNRSSDPTNRTEFGAVIGRDAYWGHERWLTPLPRGSHEAALAAFDHGEAKALRAGLTPRDIKLEDRLRPLDDMPLVQWLHTQAQEDELAPAQYVEKFATFGQLLEVTKAPLKHSVELGPPATQAQLAAYDATLPSPMPPEMRELWATASSIRWQVGDRAMRLLSPEEVVALRQPLRERLRASVKKRYLEHWNFDVLDVLFVDGADDPQIAFDVRQESNDCWLNVDPETRTRSPWNMNLARALGDRFLDAYVDALVEATPVLKKLKYGQSIDELGTKRAPKTKAAPKPKAKKSKPKRR